jgi:hypothetical protein
MTAKVIRRASPTRPSSPFFGNPIDAGRRSAGDGRASPARGHGVEGASFAEFASVQEQVKQIEGRNHTHAVDKRGAHCAVGPTTYHGPRSRGWRHSEWMVGSAPPPARVSRKALVVRDRARADCLTARSIARVALRYGVNEKLTEAFSVPLSRLLAFRLQPPSSSASGPKRSGSCWVREPHCDPYVVPIAGRLADHFQDLSSGTCRLRHSDRNCPVLGRAWVLGTQPEPLTKN